MKPLTSPLLSAIPGIQHAFGTAEQPRPTWLETMTLPPWRQTHGASVAEVIDATQSCGDVDALFTGKAMQPVAVVTADCVPILLSRRDGQKVAAVHAGWRGTRARILEALMQKLRDQGEDPAQWVAAIGPAIGPCCYEVSQELADDFVVHFETLLPRSSITPSHRKLDLPEINRAQLRSQGLKEVEILRACTLCSFNAPGFPSFHSYRRSPGSGRQYSTIVITETSVR